MFQIDVSTAVPDIPASSAPGTPGFFTDGDLIHGTPPTIVPAEFLNAIMVEVLNVLTGAGIAPSKATNNQLLQAIKALAGQVPVSSAPIATVGGVTVLTAAQAACAFIIVTGALTSNATLVLPNGPQRWTVINATSGAFSLLCQTAAGAGVTVTQGHADTVVADGTNVVFATYDVTLRPYGDSSSAGASTLYVDRAVAQVGGYYQDAGSVANAYIVALNPAVSSYDHPVSFLMRTTRANTGAATINYGAGAVSLKTEGGAALAAGDIVVGSIVSITHDPSVGYAVINELVPSQLGAMAREGIGQGLEDDGAGNARVKLADSSMRRSASGVQTNDPLTTVAASQNIASANHGSTLQITGAAVTLTAPATATLWNGYNVTVNAQGGPVTFSPNAIDKVAGGAAGVSYTIVQGQSVNFVTDGAGNWWPLFQTAAAGSYAPRYINSSQSLGAGTYNVDTSAGSITITLPGNPPAGTSLEFTDTVGVLSVNPLVVNPNGKTILGDTNNLIFNVNGLVFKLVYNGSDWKVL